MSSSPKSSTWLKQSWNSNFARASTLSATISTNVSTGNVVAASSSNNNSNNTDSSSNSVALIDDAINNAQRITSEVVAEPMIRSESSKSEATEFDVILSNTIANINRRKQELVDDEGKKPISNRYLSEEFAKVPGLELFLQHRRTIKSSYSRQELVDDWSHGTVTRAELHQRYSHN